MSAELSTPVEDSVGNLLREIARLHAVNRRLRRRCYWLNLSRRQWRARALRRGL